VQANRLTVPAIVGIRFWMGLSYTRSDDLVRVYAQVGEPFDVEEIWSIFSEIRSGHEPGRPLRILIVDPGSDFNPSAVDVRRLVGLWSGLFEGVPTRLALVVARDLHYGLGRMISAFAEDVHLPFGVFREEQPARVWLAEPEPRPEG